MKKPRGVGMERDGRVYRWSNIVVTVNGERFIRVEHGEGGSGVFMNWTIDSCRKKPKTLLLVKGKKTLEVKLNADMTVRVPYGLSWKNVPLKDIVMGMGEKAKGDGRNRVYVREEWWRKEQEAWNERDNWERRHC